MVSMRAPAALLFLGALATPGCHRSPLSDLPLWRVEFEADGTEVRLVQLPFEQTSYDLETHKPRRRVEDRNQDGISDRITSFGAIGEARSVETDRDFDGLVDRWETFTTDGARLRSATSSGGDKYPDRIATYDADGELLRIEIDADRNRLPELVQLFSNRDHTESRIDSDNNGRVDRIQRFRAGRLAAEEFDADEDGVSDIRMSYTPSGSLGEVHVLSRSRGGKAGR